MNPARPAKANLRSLVPLEVAALSKGWRWPEEAQRQVVKLSFVFNLASPGAKRRLLRVYRRCLVPGALEGVSEAQIYEEMVPGWNRTVTAVELQVAWSVSQEIISKLIGVGALQATVRARRGGVGGSRSPQVTRASAIRFLKSRRIPTPSNLPQGVFGGVDVAGRASGATPRYCSKLQRAVARHQTARYNPQSMEAGT